MLTAHLKTNTIANYIGQFYSIFIGIFILPFYLKYLGAESYGLVGFFTMLTSWMMLLDMGLSATLSREVARLKDKIDGLLEIKHLIRSIEAIFAIFAILAITAICVSSNWIVHHWLDLQVLPFETVSKCINLMGVMLVFRLGVGLYTGGVIGFENQVWLNVYRIIISSVKFIGAFLLIKYFTDNIYHFFIYQMIIELIAFFVIKNKIYRSLPKTAFIVPKIESLRKIAPFAISIAYTSGIWIVFTQMDKLLLSHYISLAEYGYFTLVIVVSGGVMQLAAPLSQAILPRMTSLLSNNKEDKMLELYHKGTQFISIIIISVVTIIAYFSYELLYAWTGNIEASGWAAPILVWYVLGNGILAILAFQYYLQYAHGNLKYHVRFNTFFAIITLPIIYYAVKEYGPLGAGITWFTIQLVCFIVWPPFVHSKFAKGHHGVWLIKDILPALAGSLIFIFIIRFLDFDLKQFNRSIIFIILFILGGLLLVLNTLIYPDTRTVVCRNIKKWVFARISG